MQVKTNLPQHTCNGGQAPENSRRTRGCPRCDQLRERARITRRLARDADRNPAPDLELTPESLRIGLNLYPDSPCPAVHKSVWESWARGEWAGNDESWFTELAEMRAG